jgi:hypothetical protein
VSAEFLQWIALALIFIAFCIGAMLRGVMTGALLAGVAAALMGWYPGEVATLIAQALVILVIGGVLVYLA